MSLPDILTKEEVTVVEPISTPETPVVTANIIEDRREVILRELKEIDLKSIRPLRARLFNTSTSEDEERLTKLENEARNLRQQLGVFNKDMVQSIVSKLEDTSEERS